MKCNCLLYVCALYSIYLSATFDARFVLLLIFNQKHINCISFIFSCAENMNNLCLVQRFHTHNNYTFTKYNMMNTTARRSNFLTHYCSIQAVVFNRPSYVQSLSHLPRWCKNRRKKMSHMGTFKVTGSRDFLLWIFFMNHLPPSPWK